MAIGKASDFKVYHDYLYAGIWEGLSTFSDGFNEASNNTIRLVPQDRLGDYAYESFFKSISSVVSRRDTTSTSTLTPSAMTQDENISVKLNRRFGPVTHTIDAWKKVGQDPQEMSFKLGEMMSAEMRLEMLTTALIAVEAAIEGQSAFNYDATGQSTKTMTHTHLIKGMAKMGDFAGRLYTWVFHSKPYFDLMAQGVADNVFNVAGIIINEGVNGTFNKPQVVVDAAALTDANGSLTDTYNSLCLTENAVVIEESEEPPTVAFELVTGKENLVYEFQAEWAYNVSVRGMKWDVSNGGANPTAATLGTTTNWDLAVTSAKNGPGVRIVTQ